MTATSCQTCRRPVGVCVCDRIVVYPTDRRVLILQHPQEQDVLLGSAQIVAASLPNARIVIGLSWRSLGHALGEENIDAGRWAVLYPDRSASGPGVRARNGAELAASELQGVVVLDGTWSKAKNLWWRNPWLNKMNRMTLEPSHPSIYGRLRAEPKRQYVSTLEAVAAALTLCGESPDVEKALERVFRTMVQRVRDAGLPPEARRLSRTPRRRPPRV